MLDFDNFSVMSHICPLELISRLGFKFKHMDDFFLVNEIRKSKKI